VKGANLPLWLKIAAFQPFICLTDDFELAIKQPVADNALARPQSANSSLLLN